MTCPATGACLTCGIAGLTTCPFRQTCGPNLPLCFGEMPKVTVKRMWPVSPNGMTQHDLDALRKAWKR